MQTTRFKPNFGYEYIVLVMQQVNIYDIQLIYIMECAGCNRDTLCFDQMIINMQITKWIRNSILILPPAPYWYQIINLLNLNQIN